MQLKVLLEYNNYLYQIDKYLLQIARVFLRSQPTPSPSQEGKSGVRSRMGMAFIP
ncbi:MAG: hypothetical protein F6K48_34160, partial [Okeania sp. SIO3H1]|nr:hypothetical protein [Okeania sp. SIO3H1]